MSNLMSSLMNDDGMSDAQMLSLAMQMQNQQRAQASAELQAQKYQNYLTNQLKIQERQAAAAELAAQRESRAQDTAEFNQGKAQNEANRQATKDTYDYFENAAKGITPDMVNNSGVQGAVADLMQKGVTPTQVNALLQSAAAFVSDGATPAAALEMANSAAKLGITQEKAASNSLWGGLAGNFEGSDNANFLDGLAAHNGLAIQDMHNRDVIKAGGKVMPNASADAIFARTIGAVNNGNAAAVDGQTKAQKQAAISRLAELERNYASLGSSPKNARDSSAVRNWGEARRNTKAQIDGIKTSLGSSETDQKVAQLAQTLNPQQVADARAFSMTGGDADLAGLLRKMAAAGATPEQLLDYVRLMK